MSVGVLRVHLEVLLDEVPPFAEALHDGLVSQDVLLAQVLPALPRLQNQPVHQVEVRQEVPHTLLRTTHTSIHVLQNSYVQLKHILTTKRVTAKTLTCSPLSIPD